MPKTAEQSDVESGSCSAVGWRDEEGHEDTALQKSAPLDIGHSPTEGVERAQPHRGCGAGPARALIPTFILF